RRRPRAPPPSPTRRSSDLLDHFNQIPPDVPRAVKYMQDLGFRVTEDIQDEEGTVYAAWMRRKPTVHDTAMTGGDGPRMHHVCFADRKSTRLNSSHVKSSYA